MQPKNKRQKLPLILGLEYFDLIPVGYFGLLIRGGHLAVNLRMKQNMSGESSNIN